MHRDVHALLHITVVNVALDDILLVAAAIAFARALLSLALARRQDFVTAPQNP